MLGVAAVFEGYSWLVGYKELTRRRRPGESLVQVVHGSKDPSVFTAFLEDTAALAGLAIAFLGVFFSHRFGSPRLDATASVLIGLVLVAAAAALAIETGGLLVGESVDEHTLASLRAIIAADPSVQSLGKALTMQLGPDEVLLVADVAFRHELGINDLEKAIDRIEAAVQQCHPEVKRIYFEAESLAHKSPLTKQAA